MARQGVSLVLICGVLTTLTGSQIEDKNKYFFSSPEDKDVCETLVFDKVTPYRRYSKDAKMTQISADQCCKLRGMNLYSIEKVEEPAGFANQASRKLSEGSWFWTSANNFQDKFKFRWEFGKLVGENVSGFLQWDLHEWDEGEPIKTGGLCVVAKPEGEKIVIKTADCKREPYPFICEMEPQKGGSRITNSEILRCVNSQIETIPGFPNLRIFEDTGRWPVANFCCQRHNWMLVDNVHPKGDSFYTSITEHDFGQPFEGMDYTSIWTSGNDLCEFRNWKWGCGEDAQDMHWYGDGQSTNPDNLKGIEDCVEYHNSNASIKFAANDINCDVENFIVCDTNPKCSVPEQYPCGGKDPRTYDPLDTAEEDAAECDAVTFTEKKSNDTEYPFVFHVSDKMVSWIGAKTCCEKNNMELATFIKAEDKYEASKIVLEMEFATGRFQPIETWTSSTNWHLSKRSRVAWPSGDPVAEFMLPKVRLHGDMYPLCGKLMDLPTKGINVMTADCLDKNLIMCMKEKEVVFDSVEMDEVSEESSDEAEINEITDAIPLDSNGAETNAEEGSSGESNVIDDTAGNSESTSDTDGLTDSDSPEDTEIPSDFDGTEEEKDLSSSRIPSVSDPREAKLYNKTKSLPTAADKQYIVVKVKRDRCPSYVLEAYPEKCPRSSANMSTLGKPDPDKNLTEAEKFKINRQNKRVLTKLINTAISGEEVSQHAPSFGFKLLATSVEMYKKLCPIVPADFVENAFKLFHDIHWSTSQGRTDVLLEAEYKWILRILRKCSAYSKPVHIRTEGCGEMFIAVKNCTNFVCTSPRLEFKLYGYDPIVDAMWKIYEMIHSICFPAFEESYRMFHKYAQGILDLWTSDIKLRWFNQLAHDDFWKRALGPSYEIHLVNMERCNQASIMRTFFHIRLPRNTVPDRTRMIGGKHF